MNSSPTRYRCWLTTPSFCNPKRNPMIPLEQKLLDLNLTVMSHRLETTLSEAAGKNLSAAASLEWLADMELEARHGRAIERRFKCSKLQAQPSIDAFHFSHHKSRSQNKNRVLRLLDLTFIANGTNLVLIGNPGVGKTFLSKIVGWRACQSNQRVLFTTAMDMLKHLLASQVDHSLVRKLKAYTEPALLICDELGYLALDQQSSNLFYQVISTKAAILGIADRVFTLDAFLEKVTAENPSLVDYKVLAVKKTVFGTTDVTAEFFESFRQDYGGIAFDRWFARKADETTYVCYPGSDLVAFLDLKVEGPEENYRSEERRG